MAIRPRALAGLAPLLLVLPLSSCSDDAADTPADDAAAGNDAAVEIPADQRIRTADPYARGYTDTDFPRITELAPGVFAYEQLRSAGEERFTTVSMFVVTTEGVLVADGQGSVEETQRMNRILLGEDARGDAGAASDVTASDFGSQAEEIDRTYAAAGYLVRDRRNPQPGVRNAIERLAQFLTLVGLTAMLVGGVGVANSVASYLDRKRKVIATFKSLGATGRSVFIIYLFEIVVLALLGIAAGLLAGLAIPLLVLALFGDQLPVSLVLTVTPQTVLTATAYGGLVALVFALWPLGRAERVQPAALFRDAVEDDANRPSAGKIVAIVLIVAALAAFAVLTADDGATALYFLGGIAVIFAIFSGLGNLVAWASLKVPRPRRPELALALGNLSGPGALTRSVVLSLGLGLSLLVTVSLVDEAMVRELENDLPKDAPNYFFLDIPKQDLEGFKSIVRREAPTATVSDAPMLRGRIVELGGRPAAEVTVSSEAAWVLEGDRGLTFSDAVPEGSEVTSGEWWQPGYDGPPLVSFADELASGLGLEIGDTVTVNVLGRNITATVANFRTVKWESLTINFVMIFSPNTLAAAPYNMLATVAYPEPPGAEARSRLIKSVSRDYPSVTALHVQDAIDTFKSVFNRVILAIRAAGGLTLIAGAIVLAGALLTAQRRRIYQAVVLKAVGATRARIVSANLAEYLMLASITAFFAALVGGAAAFVILTYVIDVPFVVSIGSVLEPLALAIALVVVFGGIGTWRVLRAPTARVLRSEA